MEYSRKEILCSLQCLHDVCNEHIHCDMCPLFNEEDRVCNLSKGSPDYWEVEEWLG